MGFHPFLFSVKLLPMIKRILLKLSGEMLGSSGIDPLKVQATAQMLSTLGREGLQVAVVIGAGNIFRGITLAAAGMTRTPADQMGMLATLINGLALKAALETLGERVRLVTALDCPKVAESYQYDKTRAAIESGEIVIFVGGTGNPYFTTDTCAALRAAEMGVDLLVKATKVDGVYDADPHKNKGAKRLSSLTWSDFLSRQLAVMDLSAVALCMSEKIPILVCDMSLLGKNPFHAILKEKQGTLIQGEL